jgi:hypothetical protein
MKLNHGNYNAWRPLVESVLNQKVLFHHTEYSTFELYRIASYEPLTIKEKRYFAKKDSILKKELNDDRNVGPIVTLDSKDIELEELETTFKDDFKSFESDRRKALEKWQNEEKQVFGILSICIEDNIWQDLRCLKSIHDIWNNIKVATGQQTSSTWMSLLNNFYTLQMKESESLTNFVGRAIKCHNEIVEIGEKLIIFTPLQIIGKIASAIPQYNLRYQSILQEIHREGKNLTLDHLKKLFIEEDMRMQLAPRQNRNNNNNNNNNNRTAEANQLSTQKQQKQLPKSENKNVEPAKRICQSKGCKTVIPDDAKSHITKCSTCFKKSREESKQKASNILVLSTSHLESPSIVEAIYLDSGATSHITNGTTFMRDLKPCKTKVVGPSGEVVSAVKRGSIVFDAE